MSDKALIFLKEQGIISRDKSEFVIRFRSGCPDIKLSDLMRKFLAENKDDILTLINRKIQSHFASSKAHKEAYEKHRDIEDLKIQLYEAGKCDAFGLIYNEISSRL